MMADKVFRLVEEDVNEDGKKDLTFYSSSGPIATVYGWKSLIINWAASTAALIVAGVTVIQFW